MGQKDTSTPIAYVRDVREILDSKLSLILPEVVLETGARRAHAAGLSTPEAAVRICHEHSRLLAQHLLDENRTASDLTEFAIASRLDESAALASESGMTLLDLLPDLPAFVGQLCFSNEFRDTVSHIATWHRLPVLQWDARTAAGPSDQAGA